MKAIGRTSSVAIASLLAAVVLLGGWFGLVKPQKDKVNKIKAQATEQQTENDALRLHVSVLKSMAKQLPKQQAELLALQSKVPNQVQLASLLRQLVAAAKTSGVTLTAFTPQQPQDLTGAPGVKYVDLVITFTGGYADVATYDTALESLNRTLMVKDYTLASTQGQGSSSTSASSSTDTVTATFNGRVLVRSDSAAPATSSTTGSGAGSSSAGSAKSSSAG